jgi:hypothetical protein
MQPLAGGVNEAPQAEIEVWDAKLCGNTDLAEESFRTQAGRELGMEHLQGYDPVA